MCAARGPESWKFFLIKGGRCGAVRVFATESSAREMSSRFGSIHTLLQTRRDQLYHTNRA